jgi:protein-S-isoprenylcysteine O-methyltransferase Ste14
MPYMHRHEHHLPMRPVSTRLFAALRGLLYASGFVLLWGWIVVSVRPLDSRLALSIPAWMQVPGLMIAALGGVLALACVVAFGVVGAGTPAPFDAPRTFVATGPYRYVRNPMYLGAAAVLIGVGLMLRSPSTLGVALCFVALAHAFVVLYEEPSLEHRFGQSYRQYKDVARRWLPRRPRRATRPGAR